jgi:DNA-binding YbaB/EbfC family protein
MAFFDSKLGSQTNNNNNNLNNISGLGNMDMNQIMSQATKMQEEMKKAQAELSVRKFEGSAGGGALIIVMNGKKEVISITVVDLNLYNDHDALIDMIINLINEIIARIDAATAEAINKISNEMGMPGLFNQQGV